MDFERGTEIISNRESKKESSYSETEQAQVVEGSAMDVKQVPSVSSGQAGNKRKPIASLSQQDKIIAVYRKNSGKILSYVQSIYDLNGANPRQEEQIVEEIKRLRKIQEELLNALLLEQKGSLSQESISKEAWNLIQ